MHPYERAPRLAFWNHAVASNYFPAALTRNERPLIQGGERVASAGSCFASNLIPYLEQRGHVYLRTEARHPAFAGIDPENLGYGSFSAAYGNVYTLRQLLQLLQRSLGLFTPKEDRWHADAGVFDPFRPGLRYHALTDREFDLLSAQHLRAVRAMFEAMDVFIFTLGLTEAWVSSIDGAVFPVCPGTITGEFDPARHHFVNFTVADMTADFDAFMTLLRRLNARVRVILTVSPVPLVATATTNHVLCASTYSKAALRVVAEEACRKHAAVSYFPAYEIVTGPQAPADFFEADRRTVSRIAIETVMMAFLSRCDSPPESRQAGTHPTATGIERGATGAAALGRALVEAECEEALTDPSGAWVVEGDAPRPNHRA